VIRGPRAWATRAVLLAIVGGAGLVLRPASADDADKAFAAWWKPRQVQFNKTKVAAERVAIVRELGAREEPKAGEYLSVLLSHGRPEVRLAAAQELAHARHKAWTPRLLDAMKAANDDIELEVEIIDTLGEIGDPRACDEILQYLRRPGYLRARRVLAAIKKINAPGSLKSLMAIALEILPPKDARAHVGSMNVWDWDKLNELGETLLDTLRSVTGQRLDTHEEWRGWYNENKNLFDEKK